MPRSGIRIQATDTHAAELIRHALTLDDAKAPHVEIERRQGFGFQDAIVVAIVGRVAGEYIIRLVDLLWERSRGDRKTRVEVIDETQNVVFELPHDREKCTEHFTRGEATPKDEG